MNTSMKLYEISNEYQSLVNELYNEETGEINEIAFANLKNIKDTMQNKCINITKFFKEIEYRKEAIESERKKLEAREKTLKRQIEHLKSYLLDNMQKCDINKIECPQFIISLKQNPPSVNIVDELDIDDQYKKVEITLDKAKISSDLKSGKEVKGAELVRKYSIQIR